MAFLLALTAVVPAHAETMMESELALPPDESPVVNVTVPATGRIILNPYGLPVEVDGETTTEQIASETMTLTNNGGTPVAVSASAAGRISERSSMVFAAMPPPADAGEKEIFLYAEFQNEDGCWSGSYSGEANQVLISATTSETKEVLTLDAASEGVFRLFGTTAVSPAEPWCSDDAISVTLTFTFTALTAQSEDVETPSDEEPIEDPTEKPTEEPAGESAEGPTGEPTEEPAEEPAGEPAGEPTQER